MTRREGEDMHEEFKSLVYTTDQTEYDYHRMLAALKEFNKEHDNRYSLCFSTPCIIEFVPPRPKVYTSQEMTFMAMD